MHTMHANTQRKANALLACLPMEIASTSCHQVTI